MKEFYQFFIYTVNSTKNSDKEQFFVIFECVMLKIYLIQQTLVVTNEEFSVF